MTLAQRMILELNKDDIMAKKVINRIEHLSDFHRFLVLGFTLVVIKPQKSAYLISNHQHYLSRYRKPRKIEVVGEALQLCTPSMLEGYTFALSNKRAYYLQCTKRFGVESNWQVVE